MLPRTYDKQVCSIARTLEHIGDRWTMLIVRDAFLGVRRFDDFQRELGVARNVLTDRLGRLVDEGILEKSAYQERPERFEYRLTEKGKELQPAILTLMKWGDDHLAPDGPPVLLEHTECGHDTEPMLVCSHCREPLNTRNVKPKPGPGLLAEQARDSEAA